MTPEQLRISILQYAIQGKLVEQRPEEGSAEELYRQIQEKKQRLIKEGKIKKEKPLSEITEDEIPFDIPESWKWVRLSEVIDVRDGTHDSPKYVHEGIPLVTSKNLSNGMIDYGNIKYITQKDADKINERSAVDDGDILFAMIGSIGNPVIVKKDREFCIKNMALFKRYTDTNIEMSYMYWFFYFVQYSLKAEASGGVQSFISLKRFREYPFPLSPYEEQKRIARKIEELLPYVDRYAEAYEKLEQFNAKFPEDMKKSILQYAIQGKLVEQRPEEGTAEDLYNRIKTGNKVKEIDSEEYPFDIPENWKWVRMGEIGNTNIGLTYKPTDRSDQGVIVLRSSNIQNGRMDYADIVKVQCEIPERAMISKGDLLICARNGSRSLVGKAAVVDRDGMAFGAFMAKFSSPINSYIYYFLQSPIFRGQLDGVKTETINQITQDMLKNQLLPLPPLAEQHRIVAKIEELLPYCDRLVR